jgi:hypothetical protein
MSDTIDDLVAFILDFDSRFDKWTRDKGERIYTYIKSCANEEHLSPYNAMKPVVKKLKENGMNTCFRDEISSAIGFAIDDLCKGKVPNNNKKPLIRAICSRLAKIKTTFTNDLDECIVEHVNETLNDGNPMCL